MIAEMPLSATDIEASVWTQEGDLDLTFTTGGGRTASRRARLWQRDDGWRIALVIESHDFDGPEVGAHPRPVLTALRKTLGHKVVLFEQYTYADPNQKVQYKMPYNLGPGTNIWVRWDDRALVHMLPGLLEN